MEEREWIELGFKKSTLKVIVATSTLSSGVNLPAKRVIIRSAWAPGGGAAGQTNTLSTAVYRQMVGRAGRKGIDTSGSTYFSSFAAFGPSRQAVPWFEVRHNNSTL